MSKRKVYDILFEDEQLLIANKAAGTPVIREREAGKRDSLVDLLQSRYLNELLLVHRIDRGTSGLVAIAKDQATQRNLSEQFMRGKVEKKYLAIVEGSLDQEDWTTIDQPILKTAQSIQVRIDPKGKASVTRFRTLENFGVASLLELELVTGRTHQIRIHLSYTGYPLLVDKLYGNREAFYLSSLKNRFHLKKHTEEIPLIARQTLHASQMTFLHPLSGASMSFEAPLPKDMNALIYQLRKLTNS